jgi:hypothetical protein
MDETHRARAKNRRPLSKAPRSLSDEPLPPYSFVPGRFPHPFSNPAGHSHGQRAAGGSPADSDRWQECLPYLRGLDLFNHGYYWEAHEAWEGLWHACGRRGPSADFFKGLIQLAVAGVKVREGKPAGVRKHAARAAELFRQIAKDKSGATMFGLTLATLTDWADAVARQPPSVRDPEARVEVLFDFALVPGLTDQCGKPKT